MIKVGRLNVQGSRARDSQRKRLYEAEDAASKRYHGGRTPCMSMTEVQVALDQITMSRWFRRRWRINSPFVIKDGRGTSHAFARGTTEINLPRWARERGQWVLLHEVTHTLVSDAYAWHGPEFAKTYLALVGQFIGASAAQMLREEYARHRVCYRTGNADLAPRWVVATQAQVRERHAARAVRPLTLLEKSGAAETLRRAVKAGMFGASGTKARTTALSVARTLEKA
jgi:putative metallohydrolase (TIGR04338 family)